MHDKQEQRGPDAGRRREPNRPRRAVAAGPLIGMMSPQAVAALQRTAGNTAVARMIEELRGSGETLQRSAVHDVLRSPGRPLDEPLRTEMEARLGADFSDVRVHSDAAARRSAADVGARAYTSGSHVVIGAGASDKHTMAHELAHVIQQRQGPVDGTDNGSGLRVSDPSDAYERRAETDAARAMAGPVPAGPAHPGHPGSAGGPEPPAVQRRTATDLAAQTQDIKFPDGADREKIEEKIEAYDKLSDDELVAQRNTLTAIQGLLPVDAGALGDIVAKELKHVDGELDRLAALTETPEGAYELMTEDGLLWQDEAFAKNVGTVGKTGKKYFEEISRGNVAELVRENSEREDAWQADIRPKLSAELLKFVVRHYTSPPQVPGLLEAGMKTRAKLEVDAARSGGALGSVKHNTHSFDVHGLANTGFLFYFVEDPDRQSRSTGFGEVRITFTMEESGLLSTGWVMLADFYNRNMPTLMANPATGELKSYSLDESKFLSENPDFTQKIRSRRRGTGGIRGSDGAPPGMTRERRKEVSAVRSLLADEEGSVQQYGIEKVPTRKVKEKQLYKETGKLERPELLHQNILVGDDIIPGLVERLLADIARVGTVHPEIGEQLRKKSPKELVNHLLAHVVRLQAMVPAPKPQQIRPEHIEYLDAGFQKRWKAAGGPETLECARGIAEDYVRRK